jgi:hypothetical protein
LEAQVIDDRGGIILLFCRRKANTLIEDQEVLSRRELLSLERLRVGVMNSARRRI